MAGDHAKRHEAAALTHDEAGKRHDGYARIYRERGDEALAALEERNAEVERAAAQIERERAALVREREG
jgi:hypothetical protein